MPSYNYRRLAIIFVISSQQGCLLSSNNNSERLLMQKATFYSGFYNNLNLRGYKPLIAKPIE